MCEDHSEEGKEAENYLAAIGELLVGWGGGWMFVLGVVCASSL